MVSVYSNIGMALCYVIRAQVYDFVSCPVIFQRYKLTFSLEPGPRCGLRYLMPNLYS